MLTRCRLKKIKLKFVKEQGRARKVNISFSIILLGFVQSCLIIPQ